MRRLILFVAIFGVAVFAQAREPKVKTVTFENTYTINTRESLEKERLTAIGQTKLKAIEHEFGSALSQTNHLSVNNSGEENRTRFNSYSVSDVNGEWIEDISEEVDLLTENGIMVYHVKLKGKIRELINNSIDIDWAILANGTDPVKDRRKDETFSAGEYMFLWFMSPVDGYLAIYLADADPEEPVQCLVPYRGISGGAMKIEAGKPYVFFSREDADREIRPHVCRIKMAARKDVDFNQLYIVFSPNEFVKAADTNSRESGSMTYDRNGKEIYLMPRQTEFGRFQKWLANARQKDRDMQLVHTILKIEK